MVVWWLCWYRPVLMRNIRQIPYPQCPTVRHDFRKPRWGVACVLCVANSRATSYLGDRRCPNMFGAHSGYIDVIGAVFSWQWAICSAFRSHDIDVAMLIRICESWLLEICLGFELTNKWRPIHCPHGQTAGRPCWVLWRTMTPINPYCTVSGTFSSKKNRSRGRVDVV